MYKESAHQIENIINNRLKAFRDLQEKEPENLDEMFLKFRKGLITVAMFAAENEAYDRQMCIGCNKVLKANDIGDSIKVTQEWLEEIIEKINKRDINN